MLEDDQVIISRCAEIIILLRSLNLDSEPRLYTGRMYLPSAPIMTCLFLALAKSRISTRVLELKGIQMLPLTMSYRHDMILSF